MLGDQPVPVELGHPVKDGPGGALREDRAADHRDRCESDAVEQGEDRVVGVVEAGELGGTVEVVGGADLVDAVQEREVAEAVGRRRVVFVSGRRG